MFIELTAKFNSRGVLVNTDHILSISSLSDESTILEMSLPDFHIIVLESYDQVKNAILFSVYL